MSYRWPPEDLLAHILEELVVLEKIRETSDEDAFQADIIRQRAAVRSLEVIGEATKRLDERFRNAHPDVPWREMARMRDRFIHGYEGVDYQIVWDVIANEAPRLTARIRTILAQIDTEA